MTGTRVRELIVQYRAHPSGAVIDGRQIADPTTAAAVLIPLLENQPQECFIVLHLDSRRHLLGVQEVTRGDLAECQPSIRTILTACLGERNSSAIVLAHNHPSGDPTPSPDDLSMTRQIIAAAAIFGIVVIDHLIIGHGSYCSLQATGRMNHL